MILVSAESETSGPYQTYAGDARVVCDVGDVEDFSFILTAGLGTCGGQREGDKGELQVEGGAKIWKMGMDSDQPS